MEKAWQFFFMLVIASLLGVLIYFIISPNRAVKYQLYGDYNNGIPAIKVDIENASDDIIHLSKDVSWNEAVRMVDSLNMTLKK